MKRRESGPVVIVTTIKDDYGLVGLAVLAVPRACGCGRTVAFVKNRDGKTRCIDCDDIYTGEANGK